MHLKFMTDDVHWSLQPFARVITERLKNIQIDELNLYFGEETLEECQNEPTKNKADEPLTSFQRENLYKEDK